MIFCALGCVDLVMHVGARLAAKAEATGCWGEVGLSCAKTTLLVVLMLEAAACWTCAALFEVTIPHPSVLFQRLGVQEA